MIHSPSFGAEPYYSLVSYYIRGTGEAFALPGGMRAGLLSPAVRALSAPRDAEAEAETLALAARAAGGVAALPKAEARTLRGAVAALEQQRVAAFTDAAAALRSKKLRAALRSLRRPKVPPQPRSIARLPAQRGAGELLNASAQQLLQHEAWCVVLLSHRLLRQLTSLISCQCRGINELWPAAAPLDAAAPWERTLRAEAATCATLHELRKRIRELRYSMERFAPLFNADSEGSYQTLLGRLATMQAAIGTMHDVQVALQQTPQLAKCDKVAESLARAHGDAWGAFRAGRAVLLASRGREAMHAALLPEP